MTLYQNPRIQVLTGCRCLDRNHSVVSELHCRTFLRPNYGRRTLQIYSVHWAFFADHWCLYNIHLYEILSIISRPKNQSNHTLNHSMWRRDRRNGLSSNCSFVALPRRGPLDRSSHGFRDAVESPSSSFPCHDRIVCNLAGNFTKSLPSLGSTS